ncbi:MAG: prepilin-type N-terminal cleavage/methylation domain-containing protein [Deltaproteobacteria bacterium]|nr:prepilin-type N-terminal cleavage/methylation domain-containing protein [Deltaproteobacteria bacterium]
MGRGFTLLEVIFVIAILAVLVITAVPRLNLSPAGLDAAARKIRSDILYAQSLAMSRGVPHGILFTAGGSYILYQGSPATPITDPLTRTSFSEDLDRFYQTFVTNDYQVEFDLIGQPTIGAGGNVVIQNGVATKMIQIGANTGRVTIP